MVIHRSNFEFSGTEFSVNAGGQITGPDNMYNYGIVYTNLLYK